jgi:hypothetical protein
MNLIRSALSVKSKASNAESPGVDPESRLQRRHDFWHIRPWELERVLPTKRNYAFPESDLLTNLVTIYFTQLAPMMPLLHRPTFMKAFDNGLHLRDDKFGALVLLVCATASRYSDDPRTLLEGGHLHSAGWKWFSQVEPFTSAVLCNPELYDLQVAVLSVIYVHGMLPPHEAWIMVGIGLRLAQDLGAHSRQSHRTALTVEDELLKRAFWALLVFDVWTSSYLGRPLAISEESYDVELPVECDDEYWENADSALAFKQPPGKPCQVSYFIHLIKINLLHSHALRTIYSVNKYGPMAGTREKGWEELTVTSLDSALNSWFDSLPDHLRWDPQRENQTFFVQSAALHVAYYFIQITIHRPFIPTFGKESSLSFPAFAICGSAARASSHVADALRKRCPIATTPNIILPTFVTGVILLLSLWGAKRTGTSSDPAREIQDVYKCAKLLDMAESRWTVAGRLRDLLTDLTTAGDFTVPAESPPSNKRERDDSDNESQQPSSPPTLTDHPRRSASMGSPPYAPIRKAQVPDTAPLRASTRPGAEFTSLPNAAPVSLPSHVPAAAVKREVQSNMFGQPVHPTHPNKVGSMFMPQPYGGGYLPLGGSSGLGQATPGLQSSAPASRQAVASFRSNSSLPSVSGTAGLSAMPTVYNVNKGTPPLSTGAGGTPLSPGLNNVMPATSGLYSFSPVSTPTSTSASISSSASSPQSGFQPGNDFGTSNNGAGGGVFDMQGMDMEFGGYGVPMADKEAMLRHFAPAMSQDGQIGVDRDTMMMWTAMPATLETQDWEMYLSSMLGIGATNGAGPDGSVGVDAGVDGMGRFL